MIYSQARGDVHILTYNGLNYDFQATGDFVLAQSRVPGDNFQIQMELEPGIQAPRSPRSTRSRSRSAPTMSTFAAAKHHLLDVSAELGTTVGERGVLLQLEDGIEGAGAVHGRVVVDVM
jgi:hypothetical protein